MFFYKKLISQEYFVTLIMFSITKKGIMIRVKPFFGKLISFDNVERTELENQVLTIYKNDGTTYDFNMKNIDENDTKKLNEIFNQYF